VEPYYSDERVTLYHGDCRETTDWLAVDVLVTDPPYGIGWTKPALPGAKAPKVNEGIAGDADTAARDEMLMRWGSKPVLVFGSLRADYPAKWRRMLVFQKAQNAGLIGCREPWFRDWEPVFVLGEWPDQTPTRSAVVATRWLSNSGYSGYATKTGHPHTKPLDVMEALIDACPPGSIADPFAGSGSTLVAAKALGRRSVGVEIDERYCEVAARRLAQDVLVAG
jgi:site-specific DNA-methyltransferase (adenine-specific)